ncbi:MAG: prepilin-type N-terminal cleavage/methylation domain-containing protein [Bryobacteraceae bacterium]
MDKLKHRSRRGFSLIELLIVIAIILVILAMALPKLNRARMQAFEAGAIKAVNTINTAQAQYFSTFGRYATTLAELGAPASGTPNAAGADLISGDLAAGDKGGYRFVLAPTPTGYTINANPTTFNTTGARTFFSDQSLVIRQNFSAEPATAASGEIK